jgi:hypothetical protein
MRTISTTGVPADGRSSARRCHRVRCPPARSVSPATGADVLAEVVRRMTALGEAARSLRAGACDDGRQIAGERRLLRFDDQRQRGEKPNRRYPLLLLGRHKAGTCWRAPVARAGGHAGRDPRCAAARGDPAPSRVGAVPVAVPLPAEPVLATASGCGPALDPVRRRGCAARRTSSRRTNGGTAVWKVLPPRSLSNAVGVR